MHKTYNTQMSRDEGLLDAALGSPVTAGTDPAVPEPPRVVLHAADFSLPADWGDYGSEAVAAMAAA